MKKITGRFLGVLLGTALAFGTAAVAAESETAPDKAGGAGNPSVEAADPAGSEETAAAVRVGALKGPTSMGLVNLMEEAGDEYEFTMVTAADELLPMVIGGDLDIALLPANVAAILYQKTEGGIAVIDINTLGVLYLVSGNEEIQEITDLAGRTVYLTGKGTTPDFVLQYLLTQNGLDMEQVTLEYKSEPTEVAAVLAQDPQAIGLLPQPFATVACAQNEALGVVMDLTEEWDKAQSSGDGSRLVTGVTVARREFLEESPEAVSAFLEDHAASAEAINDDPKAGAELVVKAGIIEKAPIAEKAIPFCSITCITGEEMREALSGYLQVLYDQDPASVGGALPEEDFYF